MTQYSHATRQMTERAIARQQPAKSSASFAPVRRGLLQRKCACGGRPGPTGECEDCRRKKLQRKATQLSTLDSQPSEVPPIVHDVLRSPGQPLDSATRAFMEPRFGHDFSRVRVHTDARAAESARAVNALAYTAGPKMVFGGGQYAPGTSGGRYLLTHELTHVVQQSGNAAEMNKMVVGRDDSPLEREADQVSAMVSAGQQIKPIGFQTGGEGQVQRQEGVDVDVDSDTDVSVDTDTDTDPDADTTPLRIAGYAGADALGTIRIGWTLDDGPTLFTEEMVSALRRRGIPGTWFVMLNQIDQQGEGREDNLAKLRKLQEGGDEIGIHCMHPTISHACWFPISNPGCAKGWESTEAAMKDLTAFTYLLAGSGIQVAFVRLPTGLHDELIAYLAAKGAHDPEGTVKTILDKQNVADEVGTAGSPEAQVKADFDLMLATLRGLGLHEWGGGTGEKEIAANSWEAESSGVPQRKDTINSKFNNMIEKMKSGKRATGSFIILAHDTTAADVQEVSSDVDEMERIALEAHVRLEYYNLSDLYRVIRGEEPAICK